MSKFADLHIHTSCSDGTQTPEEVVAMAHDKGFSCIAIADHDTVDAIKPAIIAARAYDMEVIPAIELSTVTNKKDVHILGYLFDYEDEDFLKVVGDVQRSRTGRMHDMIERLNALGIDNITFEEVSNFAETKSLGRPHLAKFLVEKGWVKSNQEAFDKYLAEGQPACVPKFNISTVDGIRAINKAGGIAVLAHPRASKVDEHIPKYVEAGLGGLEIYYPNTPRELIRHYEGLVKKHGLVATGGSDAHGAAKKHTYIGRMKVDYIHVERLKKYHNEKYNNI
ncbi:MAG: putative metal-dependent phosphoesterase TrpH [Lysobacterales bacterium]|jgi:predicted metal-dependent phosphoesterase TrpH